MARWRSSNWAILVACAWLESMNGASNAFASYSQAMKVELGYDQQGIDTVGFFRTLGTTTGVGPSLLLHLDAPAWIVAALGLGHGALGHWLTYLAIAGKVKSSSSSSSSSSAAPWWRSVWAMSGYQYIANAAQNYVQTAAIVTCVRIFPSQRGYVVGLLKGFLGVSTSILLRFFPIVCGSNQACIPLAIAWIVPLLSIGSLFVLAFPAHSASASSRQEAYSWRFDAMAGILVVLAAYLFGGLLLESVAATSPVVRLLFCGVMLLILLTPSIVAIGSGGEDEYRAKLSDSDPEALCQQEHEQLDDGCKRSAAAPCIGGEFTLKQALSTSDFWLLFLVVMLGSGCASTISDNFAQLGHSLGYSASTINVCISLTSISSCLGRIGSGILSERLLHWYGTPRPLLLAVSMLGMAIGSLWGSLGLGGALYVISVLVGACEGTLWCLSISAASELFGLASFGTLLNVLTFACTPGSYLLSVLVVGPLYDSMATTPSGGTLLCYGTRCFFSSFLVLSASCVLAALVSLLVACRARNFYRKTATTLD